MAVREAGRDGGRQREASKRTKLHRHG
jgi:hypothetical protein